MSGPAIGIGHPVSDPPPVARPGGPHVPLMCAPADPEYMVRYSRIPICHTEFGIRNSRIGNREIRNHGAVE